MSSLPSATTCGEHGKHQRPSSPVLTRPSSFFSKDGKDVDRSGNLPAGTCVDTVVCHPFAFDFYLQAHAGLVGTARPCHYSVLEDDNNFKPDDLQRLTNALCYAYPRATRSVSLVTPAYLADIICTQTRAFIYAGDDDSVTPSQTSGGGSGARPQTVAFDPLQIDTMIKRGKGASEARSSCECQRFLVDDEHSADRIRSCSRKGSLVYVIKTA